MSHRYEDVARHFGHAVEIMRCSNPDCPSRTGDETAVFSTHVLIDAWGERTDTVGDIPADEHTCVYCQSEAEEIE